MQQPMNGSYYARMGIWGEPTSGPTPIGNAMNTMGSVQNIFGKQYDNIIKKYQASDAGLMNQYNMQTMPGRIGTENVKNQTDMQYYPQMQQAKLAQDQQTVNEIMARTGLDRAQASEAGARIGLIGAQTGLVNKQTSQMSNPGFMYDDLVRQMNASPQGSPRKSYFAGLLNTMMAQTGGAIPLTTGGGTGRQKNAGMMAPGMGGGSVTSPGGSSIPSMPGLTVNPMTVSRSSNKGAEYAQTSPQGDTTVYTSPTTPTVTNLQNRISAQNELSALSPTMNEGIAPYISTYGSNVSYPMDLYKSKLGDPAATARINAAEGAMQLIREKAILRLRQASPSADIGEGQVDKMVQQMYPSLPMHFLRGFNTAQNIADATNKVDQQLASANQVAAQAVASNFPTPVDQAPIWDRSAQAPSMGSFDPVTGAYRAPSAQFQAAPQLNSPSNQVQNVQQAKQPSEEDIDYTAKLHNVSPDEVRRRLGMK